MVKRFGAGQVGIQPASSRFRAGAVVGRPVSQQLIFQPQDTTEQQRQALSLESLGSIEDKIKWFEQIAEQKRQEIVTLAEQGRDTSRAREQYEQQRFISDVNIDKLKGIKSLAQQGQYTTTSLLAYASAQAGGRLDRAEMRRILREKEVERVEEPRLKESMEVREIPPVTLSVKPIPSTEQKVEDTHSISDILFGGAGEKYVGIGTSGILGYGLTKPPLLTAKQVKEKIIDVGDWVGKLPSATLIPLSPFKTISTPTYAGIVIKGSAELIPTTPGEVGVMGAATYGSIASPIIRTGVSAGVGIFGIKSLFTPSLSPEKRFIGGAMGAMGTAGLLTTTTPFMKGLQAQTLGRLTGTFRKVKLQPEGFKAVELPPEKIGMERIGIIPKGKEVKAVDVAKFLKGSPLRIGAFSKQFKTKTLFMKKPISEQVLGTSQRGLFKEGKEIVIKKPFYVSPEDPFLGIGVTRESRLGLTEPFKITKGVIKFEWGIPKRPQIGLGIDTRGFKPGKTTELELIKWTGKLGDVKKIGVTTMKGQAIDIFKFTTERVKTPIYKSGIAKSKPLTTKPSTTISSEAFISSFGIVTAKSPSSISPPTSLGSPPPTQFISPPISPPTSPPITSPVSPPSYPLITPPTTPLISPPLTPIISPSITPIIAPPTSPSITSPIQRVRKESFRIRRKKKQPKFEVGLYRYIGGKRKRLSLGTGSLQQVFALGKHRTETTLARTFQIRKVSGDPIRSLTIPFKFRKGFTPMTKKPATFVQKAKFSLGTIGEKREIHRARKRKKKK